MGEAVVPLDDRNRILDNAILSSDTRGSEYVQELAAAFPQETFYRTNPNILGPNYALPKILWLRDHRPEVYRRTARFVLWGDMPAVMLCGHHVTSFALANRTLLFDIHSETWSEPLLRHARLSPDVLGRTVRSGTVAGTVSETAARRLGLPRGVQVVVGGHDQCCNSLGAGIREAGHAVCGIGTVECITPTYDRIPDARTMLEAGLNVEHHLLPHLYVSFLYNQAGSLVKWFRNTFAAAESADPNVQVYELLDSELPEAPTRLAVLPYFEMTGPPAFVGDASGAILGLKTSTTRGEILKAIMEGETLYFGQALETLTTLGVGTTQFVATGGGARSDPWLQIKADILGVPFARPTITEGSVLGAAMLAGLATGEFASADEAAEMFVVVDRVFEPDPERHAFYREKQALYNELFGQVEGPLRRLPALRSCG
jgi:xylulokinase